MGLLATILLIPVDILNVQSSNDIEESYTTEDPQIEMMYLFLIFVSIFSVFYLKIFTIKNKIPILLITGLSLLWLFFSFYFVFSYRHIEFYSITFFLIFILNIIIFHKEQKFIWNIIGFALILIFIGITSYYLYKTS